MPLDYTILNGNKSLLDQQYMQDAFNQKKALALQALAAGSVDQATKQNALKYQLIGAGAANGAEGLAAAKAKLGQLGIDASEYSDDPVQAANQALVSQRASSPYGTLFNAEQKAISNNIAGDTTYGKGNNPYQQPVPLLNPVTGDVTVAPPTQPAVPRAPLTAATDMPQLQSNDQGSIAIPPKPVAAIDQVPPAVKISPTPTQSPTVQSLSPFNPAPQNPATETKGQYDSRIAREEAQYKLNNADVLKQRESRSAAQGTAEGTGLGDAQKTLNVIKGTLPIALQRFNDMRIASNDATYGYGTEQDGSGLMQNLYTNFKDSKTGQANAYLAQNASQAVLPELGPQLQGMKPNKFLESLATNSSGINMKAAPDQKVGLVNGLDNNYVNQYKIAAAQVRNAGGQAPTDAEIDAEVADIKSKLPQAIQSAVNKGAPPNAAPSVQASFLAKKYPNPDAIKAAVKSGDLTRDQGIQLLTTIHGMSQ